MVQVLIKQVSHKLLDLLGNFLFKQILNLLMVLRISPLIPLMELKDNF